jgi:ATP-dependent Clp protease ATP-binding subunit ClpB
MDLSKLTTKSQQALVAARDQATARNHSGIFPAHLMRALTAQTDGIVFPLLQALDVTPADVRTRRRRSSPSCRRCTAARSRR